jgi:hypothetical protein
VLAEIIRAMVIEKGRSGHVNTGFGERVEVLGQNISLAELQNAVITKCCEGLADGWEVRYGELLEYRRLHGDCRVPKNYKKGLQLNSQLATWVGIQRTFFAKKMLSANRIKLLEEIGFEWDLSESIWQRMFTALKAYKQKHGDCRVPKIYKSNPPLAKWTRAQRKAFAVQKETSHLKKLSTARIKLLEELDFDWDTREYQWQQMFAALKDYKQKHGDCRVPYYYKPNPKLARWVTMQSFYHNNNNQRLSPNRLKKLKAIEFEWRINTDK